MKKQLTFISYNAINRKEKNGLKCKGHVVTQKSVQELNPSNPPPICIVRYAPFAPTPLPIKKRILSI